MSTSTPQANHTSTRPYNANGVNETGDPFTIEEAPAQPPPRYTSSPHSAFDTQLFAQHHPAPSAAQAKKTLEEHLAETDRRIQETSKLGTTLVQQRSTISQRIRDVDSQVQGNQITPELREKLSQVEKEYQDVGRQSIKSIEGPRSGSPAVGESSNALRVDGRVRRILCCNTVHY